MEDSERIQLKEKINKLETGMSRILFILESDEKIKEKGLVEKVNGVRHDLSELLTREKVYIAKATTWGTVGGAIGGSIVLAVKFLATKIFL